MDRPRSVSGRTFTKRDLAGALQAMIDVDPRTPPLADGSRRCHFCDTPTGDEHDTGCAWTVALLMLTGNPNLAMQIHVGEDVEEAEARLDGDDADDWSDDQDQALDQSDVDAEEKLIDAAAAFITKLDVNKARRQVMARLHRDGEDADLDVLAGEPFEPD